MLFPNIISSNKYKLTKSRDSGKIRVILENYCKTYTCDIAASDNINMDELYDYIEVKNLTINNNNLTIKFNSSTIELNYPLICTEKSREDIIEIIDKSEINESRHDANLGCWVLIGFTIVSILLIIVAVVSSIYNK